MMDAIAVSNPVAGAVLAGIRKDFGDYMADYLTQGVTAGVLVADDSLREVAVQLAHEWSKDVYASAGAGDAWVTGEA